MRLLGSNKIRKILTVKQDLIVSSFQSDRVLIEIKMKKPIIETAANNSSGLSPCNSIVATLFGQGVENPVGVVEGRAIAYEYDYGAFLEFDAVVHIMERQLTSELLTMRSLSKTFCNIFVGFFGKKFGIRLATKQLASLVDNVLLSFNSDSSIYKAIKIEGMLNSEDKDIKEFIKFIKCADKGILYCIDTIEFDRDCECKYRTSALQQLVNLLDKLPNLKSFFVKYIYDDIRFTDCMESFKCTYILSHADFITGIRLSDCMKLKTFDCALIGACELILPQNLESFSCQGVSDAYIDFSECEKLKTVSLGDVDTMNGLVFSSSLEEFFCNDLAGTLGFADSSLKSITCTGKIYDLANEVLPESLEYFHCQDIQAESRLDFTNCKNLKSFICLDIKEGAVVLLPEEFPEMTFISFRDVKNEDTRQKLEALKAAVRHRQG